MLIDNSYCLIFSSDIHAYTFSLISSTSTSSQTGNFFLFCSWKKPLWVLTFVASTTDGIFNDSENEKFLSNFFRPLPVIFESVAVARIFLYKDWDLWSR